MAFKIHCIGETNDGGGIIDYVPQDFVTVDGQLVSVDGSMGTAHGIFPHCYHCWVTMHGATWLTIDGIPVNHETNADSCAHERLDGVDWVTIHP